MGGQVDAAQVSLLLMGQAISELTLSLHAMSACGGWPRLMGIAAYDSGLACTKIACRDCIACAFCWPEGCRQATAAGKGGLEGAGLHWALPAL